MGAVYKATQISTEKPVAIKVVPEKLTLNPSEVRRFQREVKYQTKFYHPNTISVIDFSKTDRGQFYFVMYFLDGKSLRQIILDEGQILVEQFRDLASQMCDGLHYLHDQGITHKDIKAENIIIAKLGHRNVVKILDFDLAKAVVEGGSTKPETEITQYGRVLGTPAYMSPEQVKGEIDKVGPRSDIYSLGVIFYQMLSGQLPFKSDTPWGYMNKHITENPTPIGQLTGNIPNKLEKVIMRCLAKNPDNRYQSALTCKEDMADALVLGPSPSIAPTEVDRTKIDHTSVKEQIASDKSSKPLPVVPRQEAISRKGRVLVYGVAAAVLFLIAGFYFNTISSQIENNKYAELKSEEQLLKIAEQKRLKTKLEEQRRLEEERVAEEKRIEEEMLMAEIERILEEERRAEKKRNAKEKRRKETVAKLAEQKKIDECISQFRENNIGGPSKNALKSSVVCGGEFRVAMEIKKDEEEKAIEGEERRAREEAENLAREVMKNEDRRRTNSMVFVEGGCFEMGNTFEKGDNDEKPVHRLCVDDFNMDKYEVTQIDFQNTMGRNPSKVSGCSNCPVETVTWFEAKDYCEKLGKRLPTEAEWEYAARSGGKKEKYAGTNDNPDSVAWYRNNSGKNTHSVGQKEPNGLNLYDMSGNVLEWVGDWYGKKYYKNSPKDNPKGPSSGKYRVLRGGSWDTGSRSVRVAYRARFIPDIRISGYGFRCSQ